MPEIVALTCRSWRLSTRLATGVWPLTCPPLTAEAIQPAQLHAPLLYIRLHGLPDQPFLYGDGWQTALAATWVAALKLPASLVFLEGCYGAQLAEAFMAGGARAVVGNNQPTFGRRLRLGPAQQIGRAWLRQLRLGWPVSLALRAAQRVAPLEYREGWRVYGDLEATL